VGIDKKVVLLHKQVESLVQVLKEFTRRQPMNRSFKPRGPRPPSGKTAEEAEAIIRRMRAELTAPDNYRTRSLKLHGWICAKCGREFELNNLHLLTVHHKDGNHNNNPADGSNWENLCVWCHDDEHSRSLLADYLEGNDKKD
jgi:5-methylcytosine-specific restriction endonuclease McrA